MVCQDRNQFKFEPRDVPGCLDSVWRWISDSKKPHWPVRVYQYSRSYGKVRGKIHIQYGCPQKLSDGGHAWQDYAFEPHGPSIVDEMCNYCGKRIYDKRDSTKSNSVQEMGEVIRSYRIAAESVACGGMLPILDEIREVQEFLGICPDFRLDQPGKLQPAMRVPRVLVITPVEIKQPPPARLVSVHEPRVHFCESASVPAKYVVAQSTELRPPVDCSYDD